MNVLVTGVKGQLGYDVMNELQKRGHIATGVDVDEMDITDSEQVEHVFSQVKPEAVVHCAAYTQVDKAEDEQEICQKVNVDGTEFIARECEKLNCKLIYLSTDYVFDGKGEMPFEEDEPHKEPQNVYGRTKYEGELAVLEHVKKHFIVRISWVFGVNGNNFIKTMLRLGKERDELNVIGDQFGSPTYTQDLSRLLVDMVETDRYGVYHATNEGVCSWYEFACEIFRQAGLDVKVNKVSSEEFAAKAVRPKNSRMCKDKLDQNGFKRLPSWQDALTRYLEVIK